MSTLHDKVALVTGGGRGIGRAIVLALAAEGCHVALTGRNTAALEEVAAAARKSGGRAEPVALDLERPENAAAIADHAGRTLGPVDFLVNNAAILEPGGVLETTLESWDRTMSVNLRSAFLLSQRLLPGMIARKSGYIVNICSTVAHGVKPEVTAYGISKRAMIGLSEALYATGRPHGVRVSTVYPGVTDTPMLRERAGGSVGTPDQWMQPEDIASCVLFLLRQPPRMIVRELTPWAVSFDRI